MKRRDENGSYQLKKHQARLDNADSLNKTIAAEWLSQWEEWMQRHTAVQASFVQGTDEHLNRLKSLSVASSSCVPAQPIADDSPLWTQILSANLSELFYDIISDPSLDLSPYLGNLLHTSHLNDPPGPINRVKFYIRRKMLSREHFYNYLYAYPADAVWTISQLLRFGESLQKIKEQFSEAMKDYHHAEAVLQFFDTITVPPDLQMFKLVDKMVFAHYAGFTLKNSPGGRCNDDFASSHKSRFVDFNNINNFDCPWDSFHIPGLDIKLSDELEIRTNLQVSQTEELLIDLFRSTSLNSAQGGIHANRVPPPWAIGLMDRLIPKEAHVQGVPLGEDECASLCSRLTKLLYQELDHFVALTDTSPSLDAIADAVKNAVEVVRKLHGHVMVLNLLKDCPHEAFFGRAGGMWDGTVGRGLHEQRNIYNIIYPDIPTTGDLDVSMIARYIGPSLNFWRFTLDHWTWYTLSKLLCSRFITELDPILIRSSSSVVAAILYNGSMINVWSYFGSDTDACSLFAAGQIPSNMHKILPSSDRRYETIDDNQFVYIQARVLLTATGPRGRDIHLWVPQIDPGSFKYDPCMAEYRFILALLAGIVSDLTIKIAATRLASNDGYDRENDEEVENWMRTTQGMVNKALDKDPEFTFFRDEIQTKLSSRQQIMNHLRQVVPATARDEALHAKPPKQYHISNDFEITTDSGPLRLAQYNRIVDLARTLEKIGLPPDPDHLVPYPLSPFSSEFRTFFFDLAPGKRISAVAKTFGGSIEARARQLANQAKIGVYNTQVGIYNRGVGAPLIAAEKVSSEVGNREQRLLEALQESLNSSFHFSEDGSISTIEQNWRYAECSQCKEIIVAKGRNEKHHCSSDPMATANRIVMTHFSTLQRILFPHDLLNLPRLASLIPKSLHPRYVASSANGILLARRNETRLPSRNIMGHIYVEEKDKDDTELLLTLAYDLALQQLPDKNPQYSFTTSTSRHACWGKKITQELIGAIQSNSKKISLLRCNHGTSTITTVKVPRVPTAFPHHCPSRIGNAKTNCGTHQSKTITRFIDLPMDVARRLWYHERFENGPIVHTWGM